MCTYEVFRTQADSYFSAQDTQNRKDSEIKNSKEEFNKEDSLLCNGLRSYIENKEITSLYLF